MGSEMRMNEVVLAGRLKGDPVKLSDETVHFRLEAAENQEPFHCVCAGETAQNLLRFCKQGDEVSLEGGLCWREFANEPRPVLLIQVRFISFGRKMQTLRQREV